MRRHRIISAALLALAVTLSCGAQASSPPQQPAPLSQPGEPSISDVTVLLPWVSEREHVEHTITTKNGCFSWTTSNPNIARLELGPVERYSASGSQCRSSVRVIAATQKPGIVPVRASAVVIANDQDSGKTLRCDVFMDTIAKIDIGSRTREVYKDDEELLQVQAYDTIGNVFTTLIGVLARWEALQHDVNQPALRIGRFSESHLDIPVAAAEMERRGQQTAAVILRGEQFGKANVSIQLLDHQTVLKSSVVMTVLMRISLNPITPLHMAPGTHFQYHVTTPRRGSSSKSDVESVPMPDKRYTWQSTNEKVATVDSKGYVTAVAPGEASIRVYFSTFKENAQEGLVTVSEPHMLSVAITPTEDSVPSNFPRPLQSGFFLITEHKYDVNVSVYDEAGEVFTDISEMKFEITAEKRLVQFIVPNNGHPTATISTLAESGRAPMRVVLQSIAGRRKNVEASPDFTVTPPVHVEPATVLLPFVAEGLQPHTFQFGATGGSGEYRWESDSSQVAPVNGLGITTAVGLGSAHVTAVDAYNIYNRASTVVHVATPASLEFVPALLEAPVGENLVLSVLARDRDGSVFSNCTLIPVAWDVAPVGSAVSPAFDLLSIAQQEVALPRATISRTFCNTRVVVARHDGQAVLTARLELATSVFADVRVFAYRPLEVSRPASLPAVVSIGSSVRFITEGGPAPWYLDPTSFMQSTEAEAPAAVAMRPDNIGHSIVTCLELGEQRLTLRASNKKTHSHPFVASSSVEAPWACAEPQRILLSHETTSPDMASVCSSVGAVSVDDAASIRAGGSLPTKVMLRNDRSLLFSARVLDAKGRQFYNDSSLVVSWKTSDEKLLLWNGENSWERTLQLAPREGVVRLSVSVSSYNKTVLDSVGVRLMPALRSTELTREVDVTLVRNVAVEPSAATLLNHPDNTLELRARYGSSKYRFAVDDSTVAAIEHIVGSATCRLRPLRAGVVRVSVTDMCLGGSSPVFATITISDLRSLQLIVPDLVEKGGSLDAQVSALDATGNVFSADQLRHLSVALGIDAAILTIADRPAARRTTSAAAAEYTLVGSNAGVSAVTATVVLPGGRVVTSNTVQVYVFPRFTISPREVSLLPGSSVQLQYSGGPPVRGEVTFEVEDGSSGTVASMSAEGHGIIMGRSIGTATVRATVTATHSVTRARTVYGSDTAGVVVRHLTGIRVRSASSKLVTGTEEKIWVEGLQDETPFALATIGMKFEWRVVDSHVAELRGFFEEVGQTLAEEHGYSARVLARSRGKTTISVSVISPLAGLTTRNSLSSSFQIAVIDPLVLTSPAALLLPPQSSFQIQTSKDSHGNMRYQVLGTESIASPGHRPLLTVDRNGVVRTTNALGSAVVLVYDDEHEPVSVAVTVKPVSLLELLPSPTARVRDIPIGETAEIVAVLRDDSGQRFHAVPPLSLMATVNLPSIASVVQTSTAGIVVKALKPGHAIVHVQLTDNPSVEDYAPLYVGHVVEPSNPVVHIGGTVQFSTSSKAATEASTSILGRRSVWSSSNDGIVRVDGQSGSAEALAEGTAKITFQGAISTFTTIKVSHLVGVEVAGEPRRVIASGPVRIPLRFRTESGELLTLESTRSFAATAPSTPQIAHNIRVTCAVDETEWARADGGRDSATGEYFCSITPQKRQPGAYDSAPAVLRVTVSAQDQRRVYRAESTFDVEFLPPFILRERTIRLTEAKRKANIEVLNARPTLTVAAKDPQIVSVVALAEGGVGSAIYQVEPAKRPSLPFSSKVEIHDSATGQRETVVVMYATNKEQEHQQEEEQQPGDSDSGQGDNPDNDSGDQPSDDDTGLGLWAFAIAIALISATSVFVYERENVTYIVRNLGQSVRSMMSSQRPGAMTRLPGVPPQPPQPPQQLFPPPPQPFTQQPQPRGISPSSGGSRPAPGYQPRRY